MPVKQGSLELLEHAAAKELLQSKSRLGWHISRAMEPRGWCRSGFTGQAKNL
jgi:hypothetical protein